MSREINISVEEGDLGGESKSLAWYCTTIFNQDNDGLPENSILYLIIEKRNNIDEWLDIINQMYAIKGQEKTSQYWKCLSMVLDSAQWDIITLDAFLTTRDFGTDEQKKDWFFPHYYQLIGVQDTIARLERAVSVLLNSKALDDDIVEMVREAHENVANIIFSSRLKREWVEENRARVYEGRR